jgi:hypothetical protein
LEVITTFTIGPELKGYFEYDAVGLYLRTHQTAEINGVVVDVDNILGRRFLCDGLCCLDRQTSLALPDRFRPQGIVVNVPGYPSRLRSRRGSPNTWRGYCPTWHPRHGLSWKLS